MPLTELTNVHVHDVTKRWFLIDADGLVLGRVANLACQIIRGKGKASFAPHVDQGDGAVVINASKIVLTGKKSVQKIDFRASGYPGGQTHTHYGRLMAEKPERAKFRGHIRNIRVSNLHVVDGASAIQVTFADGTVSSAQITGSTPADDIAVLQADNPPATVTPAVLGNPRSVSVGSEAYVLGSPFGLYGSFSSGVVSGLNRTFQLADGTQLQGMIQVDAAVNPGNSGGPLVNRYGQVIGIVSGIVNPTNQNVFIGIGFAVPIDVAGGAAGLPHD